MNNDEQIVLALIFIVMTILLLVAGVAISIFISNKQRLQQDMKMAQMDLDYQKELRQVEAELSEQMMGHFARELHDNIGHILTLMRLQIENKKLDDAALEPVLAPIEQTLEEAGSQLRLLSRSLNSDYILNLGLQKAIELEVRRLQQLKRYTVHSELRGSNGLPDKDKELVVFRIFQEIVQNILRHANARNISVRLDTEQGFSLSVQDDGSGFDLPHLLQSAQASGLGNIMKRATLAGLDCQIDTAPGKGCAYRLRRAKQSEQWKP